MADFLDESDPSDAEVMQRLVTIREYDDTDERDREANRMRDEYSAMREQYKQRFRKWD